MKKVDTTDYFVFIRQGYDRPYYCVAGREISHNNGICFLTNDEAWKYAEDKSKARYESRSTGQRKTSS